MIFKISDELLTTLNTFILDNSNSIKEGVHFTSKNTYYNIIKSGQLYFSDLSETNDKDEIEYGKNILLAYFTNKYDNKIRKVKQLFDLSNSMNRRIFTLCLTDYKNYDNLQHWSMYSDQCSGAAIKINIEVLLNLIDENLGSNLIKYVLPIQYYNDNLINVSSNELRIDNFIENSCSILNKLYEKINIDIPEDGDIKNIYLLKILFYLFSSMIKKDFWKSEEEIRIAIFPQVEYMVKLDTNCNKIVLPVRFNNDEIQQEILNKKRRDNNYSYCKNKENKIYMDKLFEGIVLGPKNSDAEYNKIIFFMNEYNLDIPILKSRGHYN